MKRRAAQKPAISRWRYCAVIGVLVVFPVVAVWHIAGLQVLPNEERGFEFLQNQGDARTVRIESLPAYRGVITDRRGEPLAVSTPMISLWANPKVLVESEESVIRLATGLGVDANGLLDRVERLSEREFMYLRRNMTPNAAESILDLEIPGVYSRREFQRFYPAAEVTSHLLGFTNIDDRGQEGLELAYEQWLQGVPGARRVLKDRKGRIIKDLELVRSEQPGGDMALSIDLRLQYIAYRELKEAVDKFQAAAGSMVILDARTGEVLAMVNQPSFNPNGRRQVTPADMRNRVVIDQLEPGSTMKPFTVVAGLEQGVITLGQTIDTNPGWIQVGRKTIRDHSNYGVVDLGMMLAKSSNVGTVKIARELQPENMREIFDRIGLGRATGIGFPGEMPGLLPDKRRWSAIEIANLSFGHGLATTPLQIAQAYSVLANDGEKKPVSLIRRDSAPAGEQVIDPRIAASVRAMMKGAVERGGTATRGAVPGYSVAGKTGTVHKVGPRGYETDRYMGLFAGIVPADDPRLIAVVVIDDPRGGVYFGGAVAAPVFANVMTQALRLLAIPPEKSDEEPLPAHLVEKATRGQEDRS